MSFPKKSFVEIGLVYICISQWLVDPVGLVSFCWSSKTTEGPVLSAPALLGVILGAILTHSCENRVTSGHMRQDSWCCSLSPAHGVPLTDTKVQTCLSLARRGTCCAVSLETCRGCPRPHKGRGRLRPGCSLVPWHCCFSLTERIRERSEGC